jgi:hypothetical protein
MINFLAPPQATSRYLAVRDSPEPVCQCVGVKNSQAQCNPFSWFSSGMGIGAWVRVKLASAMQSIFMPQNRARTCIVTLA